MTIAVRHLLGWQATHKPPMAIDIREGRAWYVNKGRSLAAVLLRPDDAEALGVTKIDDLPVEPDPCVTPGLIFFVVGE